MSKSCGNYDNILERSEKNDKIQNGHQSPQSIIKSKRSIKSFPPQMLSSWGGYFTQGKMFARVTLLDRASKTTLIRAQSH